jgi:UDP-glucose 4-epimerase
LLLAARDGNPVVPIHGNDYPTDDGTCVRDYVHVEDLAEAHVAALGKLRSAELEGISLNLGSGSGYSVQQIVDAVGRITGRQPPTRCSPRRAGDPAVLVADSSRATALLGWNAKFSDLESIVGSAWRWQTRQLSGSDRG